MCEAPIQVHSSSRRRARKGVSGLLWMAMLPRWQIDVAITYCTVEDPGEKNWTAIADFEADIVASNGTVYADLVCNLGRCTASNRNSPNPS